MLKKYLPLSIIIFFSACITPDRVRLNEPDSKSIQSFEDLQAPIGFRFSFLEKSSLRVVVYDNQDRGMPSIPLFIYTSDPGEGGSLIASGLSNISGEFTFQIQRGPLSESWVLYTPFIGLQQLIVLGNSTTIQLGGSQPLARGANTSSGRVSASYSMIQGIKTMGTWNSLGVPNYLDPLRDPIDKAFLDDINASLPEQRPVPQFNPEYLANENDIDVKLNANADVWVTFIHEGAGHLNALGYYTYPLQQPPMRKEDIDTLHLIFPNVSFLNSGGGLVSGDRVYLGSFPATTGIGWFLIPNGYSNSSKNLKNPLPALFYSNPDFNPESTPQKRQHNVLLVDQARKRAILGFEDLNRDGRSDDDFNDAVFMVTTNPASALQYGKVQPITYAGTQKDSDGDGVPDNLDRYPNDPLAAFDNFTPSEVGYGSLVFEDLWPAKGDYDFNDLVLNYRFHYISNNSNEVVKVKATLVLKASGASYRNGFGLELPISSSLVSQVTGAKLSPSATVSIQSNGTESGHNQAVILVFDDAFHVLGRKGNSGANTLPGESHIQPDTLFLEITFTSPIPVNQLGLPPYNPFMIVNQDRGKEVHLLGKSPTALANPNYLGTLHDRSTPSMSIYYQTKEGLPFALDLPTDFEYPIEKVDIVQAYPKLRDWVQSGGRQHFDWFEAKPGHLNPGTTYRRP